MQSSDELVQDTRNGDNQAGYSHKKILCEVEVIPLIDYFPTSINVAYLHDFRETHLRKEILLCLY